MTTPPIPPRKSFLVKSSTVIGSYDLPSLQEDSDNQEENASTTSNQTGSLTDYQSPRLSPCPVRRPPVPPKTHGTLLSPSPTASGDYNNVDRSKLGMTEKALDVYGKNKPSPPPLPRPVRPPRSPMMSRSSSEYERTLPEMHLLQPQDSIERKHSQSPRPARPPARPKSETQSLYGGYDVNRSQSPRPSNTDNKRSPHPSRPPPRPGGPPSHTLSRSPSGIETTTTQLQPLLQVRAVHAPCLQLVLTEAQTHTHVVQFKGYSTTCIYCDMLSLLSSEVKPIQYLCDREVFTMKCVKSLFYVPSFLKLKKSPHGYEMYLCLVDLLLLFTCENMCFWNTSPVTFHK
ncbi:uncharacterized protein LOC135555861 isoform X2 [Oncorhynchus masou masou]|uniref:uncharacterized protein LOC135555861 isoform X2 n=1 Tax=Oncorhynchus masou masou TaxID=90313 RepID=UPI003183B65C